MAATTLERRAVLQQKMYGSQNQAVSVVSSVMGQQTAHFFSLLHREKICNTTFNDKETKNRSCLCMYERTRITGWLFWHRTDRLYVVVPFTNASFGLASLLRDGGGLFGRFLFSLCCFVAFSSWPLSICKDDSWFPALM